MRYTALFLLGALLLHLPVAAARAEEAEKLDLRSAVEQALHNNLNLQLRREDVNSAEGAGLSAEGKFDILLEASVGVQTEQLTPIVIGGAEQQDSAQWNGTASKLFTTGTSVGLSWNNSRFRSDSGSLFPGSTLIPGLSGGSSDGFLINPSYTSGMTLDLRQPLLKGFGEDVQTLTIRSSRKQLEATTYQVNSEAANLAADVKVAYWKLVFAWQDIDVQKLSLTLARKLLEETRARINAGSLAEVDIYQPESEVARREEQLISAERSIGTAEDDLKLLLNIENWQTSYQPTDQPSVEPIKPDPQFIEANALKNRPDIKAADLLVESTRLDERRFKDEIRPDLSLVGQVGLAGTSGSYGDSLDNSIGNPDNLWQVGITLSMPLENRVARGNYRQAQASHNRAKVNAELLRQQLRRTVRTTLRDIQLAIKALEATRKTSLATKKRLEAEQAKFASGRSTTLDVLTAQEAYAQALSQQNQTSINYAGTLAELDRIQGLVTFSSSR